jgi:hypothetical protein
MQRSRFVAALSALVCAAGCNDIPSPQNYATVFGRVYDGASNAGIAGVEVAADTALLAVTAADGSFTIAPVPSGQTDVVITPPPGYVLAAQPAAFSVVNGDHFRLDVARDRS